MKVLHILNELKFSGAEIMYVSAASRFQKLGCKLYVVNTSHVLGEYTPFFEKAGYEVLFWPYNPKSIFDKWKYFQKIISFLKTEQLDVVHIHRSDMKWCMSFCAWKAGCKAVYTFHNVFPTHWYSWLYHVWLRWTAKHFFGCIFQTISDSVYLHEKKLYSNSTTKIYNWYDSKRFFPAQKGEKVDIRKEMHIPENALVIVSVGGCSTVKRHSDVIKALPKILDRYSSAIYLHLGEGDTIEEEVALAESLKVKEHIRFLGNQKNVRDFLVASDIYVMSSKFEGISITTIEAMACLIPAVLYDVPGLRDFNQTEECALMIKEDYDLLSTAIVNLFEDKNKQQDLSENARNFVNTHFHMQTNINEIYKLYNRK